MVINCKGIPLDVSEAKVMGIINVNEDSFYKESRVSMISQMISKASKMVENGAAIIDIGAMSSRPGASLIDQEVEWNLLKNMIHALKALPIIISIDTIWSKTAALSIDAGAHIINDISAGNMDPQMISTVGRYSQVPYIMMHMKGSPENMAQLSHYDNMVVEMIDYFSNKIRLCEQSGIRDIIIDPGFGFAKNIDQNYWLLKKLHHFKLLEKPLLIGISRKSMLYKLLNIDAEHALNATTAAHMAALMNGAKILRVHDVKEAVEAITIYRKICSVSLS